MKEKMYTIPLMDAFRSDDECPFCFIERQVEQRAIAFILGSAYMEDDIREQTDEIGFCRTHLKKMYDYGNQLGNALMMKTHMIKLNKELDEKLKSLTPTKSPLLQKFKKTAVNEADYKNPVASWANEKEKTCYVCNYFKEVYPRYIDTFFELVKKNDEFIAIVEESKGFCLPHFKDLLEQAPSQLNEKQQQALYPLLKSVMAKNMKRVEEDVAWFVEKYDYRNKDADWKNSRDAVQRAMQKVAGGHPADPVFMSDR